MTIYSLHSTQKLPISIEEAWRFFSDPKNLKVITPPYMGFDITAGGDRPMFAGQIIQYIVTPVAGIRTKWVTEITHVQEPLYFVDEQRFGPYALWHHKHFFRKFEGGVEMEDIVDYKLPFGILGRLVHKPVVRKKLEEIFNFRQKKLLEIFGSYKERSA
ncbi:Ligand-binding SRPBCC domain-containing protein [Salinimicrobium sediminis]|uniref:Ligand-binding SRPBCC domain-containing protein n=1 Tax=Salinimicrobium sediminis TaxID=1343891 RepID=A0A285X4C9_9FLAO|nr:SRPBCC family protein [Salinimicrobium sediminis]SOC80203.1 Ligand-binding SRPBCC domain-containing protein [Salinimicrobium sediminis]